MREYRSAGGERRLWYDPDEIEHIMEDELRSGNMFPTPSDSVVDIETFIELHLRARLDTYAVLDAEILGETRFTKDGRPSVLINRQLTRQAEDETPPSGILGRWRATLAHEAAHVILHRVLFEVSPDQSSFWDHGALATPTLMRCLHRDIVSVRNPSDWREVQANRGMASLLMPRKPFTGLVRKILGARRAEDLLAIIPDEDSGEFKELLTDLSLISEVSQQAAHLRLKSLGLVRNLDEPMLGT